MQQEGVKAQGTGMLSLVVVVVSTVVERFSADEIWRSGVGDERVFVRYCMPLRSRTYSTVLKQVQRDPTSISGMESLFPNCCTADRNMQVSKKRFQEMGCSGPLLGQKLTITRFVSDLSQSNVELRVGPMQYRITFFGMLSPW